MQNIIRAAIHAVLVRGMRGSDTKHAHPMQRDTHRTRPPWLLHCAHGCRQPADMRKMKVRLKLNEWLKRFSSRLAECSSQSAWLVHSALRFGMPCHAEARREPSRSVCSVFRISKRFHTEMVIWRCMGATRRVAAADSLKSEKIRPTPKSLKYLATKLTPVATPIPVIHPSATQL